MAVVRQGFAKLPISFSALDQRIPRGQLADKLLSSLSSNRITEEAWAAAVDGRRAEFETGNVRDIPIEEPQARARKAIR